MENQIVMTAAATLPGYVPGTGVSGHFRARRRGGEALVATSLAPDSAPGASSV